MESYSPSCRPEGFEFIEGPTSSVWRESATSVAVVETEAQTVRPDVVPFPSPPAEINRHTPVEELPATLTVAELGEWLQLDRDASYALAARIGIKVGRYWRIPRHALEAMLNKK